ncbi:hypothetical protein L6Q96_18345 [Candidatus Binatia bacterium]|nr:hypothetical protein [Candidatus Binatia bacterium]
MGNRSVGQNVDGWCAKCKLVLAHTIEALIRERITRVHCNTCGAQHAWRANAPGSTTRATRSRSSAPGARRTSPRTGNPPVDYDALVRGRDGGAARSYSVRDAFRVNDLLAHPTFGLGVVTSERGDKIDVIFREGSRTLAQRRD